MPRKTGEILGRSAALIRDPAGTPLEFLDLVEELVRASQLTGLEYSRVGRREGGPFSPRRIYLRIRLERMFFDVTAFVSGNALSVSYWLHKDLPGVTDLLCEIPVLGFLIQLARGDSTYFRVDDIETTQRMIDDAFSLAVEEFTTMKRSAELPPLEDAGETRKLW